MIQYKFYVFRYDLEPAVLHVTVTNQHVTSMTDFQVTGYSMQGKVLYKKEGQPISGGCMLLLLILQN